MTYRQSEVKQASAGEHTLPQHIVLLFVVHLKIYINLTPVYIIIFFWIFFGSFFQYSLLM